MILTIKSYDEIEKLAQGFITKSELRLLYLAAFRMVQGVDLPPLTV